MAWRVFTIHGINSDGRWQDLVHHVFRPHFEYQKVKYEYYKRMGVLKIIADPLVVVISGLILIPVVAIAAAIGFKREHWLLEPALIAIFAGYLGAMHRRRVVMQEVSEQLKANPEMLPPHIVAHSMGTYLIGYLFRRDRLLRFEAIIPVGCVLPCWFNWRRRRMRFHRIWNELCRFDHAVWSAFLVGFIRPTFGGAGVFGFLGRADFVCRLADPFSLRHRDGHSGDQPRLFNVCHSAGHSKLLLSPQNALEVWLPFLWDIEISEFMDFRDLCLEAVALQAVGLSARLELSHVRAELRTRPWRWARGTIEDLLHQRAGDLLGDLSAQQQAEFFNIAFPQIYNRFAEAFKTKVRYLDRVYSESDKRTCWWAQVVATVTGDAGLDLNSIGPETWTNDEATELIHSICPYTSVQYGALYAMTKFIDKYGLPSPN